MGARNKITQVNVTSTSPGFTGNLSVLHPSNSTEAPSLDNWLEHVLTELNKKVGSKFELQVNSGNGTTKILVDRSLITAYTVTCA